MDLVNDLFFSSVIQSSRFRGERYTWDFSQNSHQPVCLRAVSLGNNLIHIFECQNSSTFEYVDRFCHHRSRQFQRPTGWVVDCDSPIINIHLCRLIVGQGKTVSPGFFL